MSMQLVAAEEAHEMFGFEPGALVTHGAPEKNQGTAVEVAAYMSKLIKLLCSAKMNTAYAIVHFSLLLVLSHIQVYSFNLPPTGSQGLKPTRNPPIYQGYRPRSLRRVRLWSTG
jgi:hypothetical protein